MKENCEFEKDRIVKFLTPINLGNNIIFKIDHNYDIPYYDKIRITYFIKIYSTHRKFNQFKNVVNQNGFYYNFSSCSYYELFYHLKKLTVFLCKNYLSRKFLRSFLDREESLTDSEILKLKEYEISGDEPFPFLTVTASDFKKKLFLDDLEKSFYIDDSSLSRFNTNKVFYVYKKQSLSDEQKLDKQKNALLVSNRIRKWKEYFEEKHKIEQLEKLIVANNYINESLMLPVSKETEKRIMEDVAIHFNVIKQTMPPEPSKFPQNSSLLESICKKYAAFMYGTRVQMLIDRGINSSRHGSTRWVNKLISNNAKECQKNIAILLNQRDALNNANDVRLYMSVNARNMSKAIKTFQHQQLDLEQNKELINDFYKRIHDHLISCLMKPESKERTYFLLDIDTKELATIDKILRDNMIATELCYETVKGFHYIVKPFNVKLIEEIKEVTIIKDGLLLLAP